MRGDDGNAFGLARETEEFLVAGRVALANGCEVLVLVAENSTWRRRRYGWDSISGTRLSTARSKSSFNITPRVFGRGGRGFTRRKISGHHGNTGSYEHIPLQMSFRNALTAISRVQCWHVVSCEYPVRKAGCQKAACYAKKKRAPGSATSGFSHREHLWSEL